MYVLSDLSQSLVDQPGSMPVTVDTIQNQRQMPRPLIMHMQCVRPLDFRIAIRSPSRKTSPRSKPAGFMTCQMWS